MAHDSTACPTQTRETSARPTAPAARASAPTRSGRSATHGPLMRGLVVAMVTSILPLALATPTRPAPAAKRKPVPSGVTSSDGAPASAESTLAPSPSDTTSMASGAAPLAQPPRSPLTPRPDEAPPRSEASSRVGASHEQLLADIAALRARVAVLGNSVWSSRLVVTVRTQGRHTQLVGARLALDGAPVWTAPKGLGNDEEVTAFELGVAPGPHALTLEIERRDEHDERFRMLDKTTTTLVVPQGKTVRVRARLEDESSMGTGFPKEEGGAYDVRIHFDTKVSK